MIRRWGIIAIVAVACGTAAAGVTLAKSSGDLVGTANGTTTQRGGKIAPTFDVTRGLFYNATGTFRCSSTATKTYEFFTNGLARKDEPAFHFVRPFTFKLKQRWLATGQNPYKAQHYEKGTVAVTITGTIKQVKAASHSAYVTGKVSGRGSVTFSAPGCSTGKLSWSGTGPLTYA